MAILEAGRATLKITRPTHKQMIDRIEADGRPSQATHLAFEDGDAHTTDAHTTTDRLQAAGRKVIAAPVRNPWQSLISRLAAPAGLLNTLFRELTPAQKRTAQPGFDTGH